MRTLPCAALAPLLVLVGCTTPLPKGYVKVEPSWDQRYKAVSADGCAISLRSETNPQNGDLAFWEKAINTRLTELRGYKAAGRQEVAHASGTKGVELNYEYAKDGIGYLYCVTLFVKGSDLYLIEAAGVKDKLTADQAEVRKAVLNWPLF